MRRNANQVILSGFSQAIVLNQIDVDSGGMGDTLNSRINIVQAGSYLVIGQIYFSPFVATIIQAGIFLNGAPVLNAETASANAASSGAPIITCILKLAVGSYLQINASQNSGMAQNTIGSAGGSAICWLAVHNL